MSTAVVGLQRQGLAIAAERRRPLPARGQGTGEVAQRERVVDGKRNGARVPVTALVDQFYADVQQLGGSRWDTSSLIKRLR